MAPGIRVRGETAIARIGRNELYRFAPLAVVALCVWTGAGLPSGQALLDGALGAMLGVFALSFVLPWQRLRAAQFGLLAVDLLAVVAIGYLLARGRLSGSQGRIPFVSGFIVATLVSVVGARMAAGVLGTLAGVMVMAMGTVFTMRQAADLDPLLLCLQIVLVTVASLHTARIAGRARSEVRARELARQVERQIRAREAAAAELVSFTQALADSHSLLEVAEAVLRHLRCHTQFDARAIVLESEGEDVALWEEAGRLDADGVERRRLRLQESLARVGSNFIVPRLKCHTSSIEAASTRANTRAAVDIPVRVGGRVAGVLLVADFSNGSLPPERVSVLVDVARRTSEAVRRLERLRDHEQRRTSLLLRQMREGVLLLGSDGQIHLANPAARRVLAACRRENGDRDAPMRIGELSLEDLGHTPPGVSRRFHATVTEAGRDHPLQLACTALSVMDQGRRVGTLVTLADVTDEELSRRRIVQAEKMTLVGQTLAGVAHELNNPLAALIGYADLLGGIEVPPELEKPVEQMKEQALRSTRIVRNLLNFARRRNPERLPASLAELIQGTVELFAYEARMQNVTVEVDVEDDLPMVLGDKHALQQILVNLVQNALHALQNWDGERTLRIVAHSGPDVVLLTVADSGPGVPEELRSRVFESFFTTKGPTKGTGLGLALSRSIAQEHGGELILAPDTGRGARFTLRLPQHDAARAGGAATLPASSTSLLPALRSVLVVDDEPSVRETLVAQLGQLGSHVDSAANVQEAQRHLRTNEYDGMVVDLRMPGSSGLDLHAWILEELPALAGRVVFMTGDFVNDDLLARARATGRTVLEKPFTMDELTRALVAAARSAGDARLSA